MRCDRRDWLLSTEEGITMAALVREFLVWSELSSTVKVVRRKVSSLPQKLVLLCFPDCKVPGGEGF